MQRIKVRAKRNLDRWRIDLLVKILLTLITLIEHWTRSQ
jgi:hypothetical protein